MDDSRMVDSETPREPPDESFRETPASALASSRSKTQRFYLPPDVWSPRYDATFFTVQMTGFDRVSSSLHEALCATLQPSSSATSATTVPGKSTRPAYYYRLVVYRQHDTHTVWRRYSQFQWLHRQLTDSASLQSSASFQLPSLPLPVVCRWQWWQDDAFGTTRLADLARYMALVLQQPTYARHEAMVRFLGL